MDKQILSSSYDTDTGILDIRLLTGEHYYVTNAGHARRIRDKISPGGRLNVEQVSFLEQYKVRPVDNRAGTLAVVRKLREELGRETR